MKNTRKLLALLLAFVMAFTLAIPAVYAQDINNANKTTKVTLHKILMNKDKLKESVFPGTKGLNNEEYKGNQIQNITGYFGEEAKEIEGVYFAVQNKDGQYVNANGEVLDDQNINSDSFKTNVLGGLTTANGLVLDTTNLPQATSTQYKIVEIVELSTYKGQNGELLAGQKAVPVEITLPLINQEGVVAEAHVYPKNTEEKPQIDKNFARDHGLTEIENPENVPGGADYNNYQKEKAKVSAELGKSVPYEVKTKINAGSRYQTLNWKDTMTNGLTFNKDLNIVAKYLDADNQEQTLTLTKDTHYKVKEDDRGFTLSLTDQGFAALNAITHPAEGAGFDVEFTLTYSAKVNKNAVIFNPETNDIKLEYSNEKSEEKEPTPVTPSNNELNVTKSWANGEDNQVPRGVNVVYTLSNGNISASVMLNGYEFAETEYDLGNGIIFTVGDTPFSGTFKGEKLTGNDWKLSERVAGYDETINGQTQGSASITNTKDNDNPQPLDPTEPQVEYHGKRFVKADENTGVRLEGAQFVVKKDNKFLALKDLDTTQGDGQELANSKSNYIEAINAWNKAVAENAQTVMVAQQEYNVQTQRQDVLNKIAKLKTAYEAAFKKAANAYEWVESKDAANVVVLVSDVEGKFEILGLEKGNYALVEIKAPEGYALPTNAEFEFIVDEYSYQTGNAIYEGSEPVGGELSPKQIAAQRVNNKKVSIPQTGGIGTIIFTVAGIVIMIAAGFVLVKNNKKEEVA